METTVYQVEGRYYLSIALAVDLTYWSLKEGEIVPLFRTSSFGEAYSVWKQLESSEKVTLPQDNIDRKWVEPVERWQLLIKEATDMFPLFQGRALLWSEIASIGKRWRKTLEERTLREILQLYYLSNQIKWFPGVECSGTVFQWYCHRCLGKRKQIVLSDCASCGKRCATCEQCLSLGRSRTCFPFILFSTLPEDCPKQVSSPALSLTSAQQEVSQSLADFLDGTEQTFLLWAVTGAGKTEMMIPTLQRERSIGKKVCWTSPRKDVVLEIADRLRGYLPETKIVSLYGGSPDLWSIGEITVATTHQLWRFANHFDLMIVDEVDAFPLYQNVSLEQGIKRATAQQGKFIFLTATPPPEWMDWSQSGRLPSSILPVRYHGYPLPIPKSFYTWDIWRKIARKKPIFQLNQFIRQVESRKGQAMIFVPGIRQVKQVVEWLYHHHPEKRSTIEGVYSQSPKRTKIISQFRNEQVSFLVTTSILERGITVPTCHVLVLGADHAIFDAASLIQIAGRVGRSAKYQDGEVWFLSTEKTEAQRQAKKQMIALNRLAEKAGFIRKGAYYQ